MKLELIEEKPSSFLWRPVSVKITTNLSAKISSVALYISKRRDVAQPEQQQPLRLQLSRNCNIDANWNGFHAVVDAYSTQKKIIFDSSINRHS